VEFRARRKQRGDERKARLEPSTRVEWAVRLVKQGFLPEAEAHLRAVLREFEVLGADDPVPAAKAGLVLAQVLTQTHRTAEAESWARWTLSLRGLLDSDDIPLLAWQLLPVVMVGQGRHEEADQEFLLLAQALTERGASPLRVARTRGGRAQNLIYLGRYAEAEAESRATVALVEQLDGPRALSVQLMGCNGLVRALIGLGRPAEAEQQARSALARADGLTGPGARLRFMVTLSLARCLVATGRYQEALSTAGEAKVEFLRSGFENRSDAAAAGTVMARALTGLGRYHEAVGEARAALTVCQETLGPGHRRIVELGEILEQVQKNSF
jgi:tetratricopeptide (TPR) repeat protein